MIDRTRAPRPEPPNRSGRRPAGPADPASDPRMLAALEEAGIGHETDDDQRLMLHIGLDDGRSHVCVIEPEVRSIGELEVRVVYAPAICSLGPLDARTMNLLMQDNNTSLPFGAGWGVLVDEESDEHVAFFSGLVAADASPRQLLGVAVAVASTADAAEEHFTGRDDF